MASARCLPVVNLSDSEDDEVLVVSGPAKRNEGPRSATSGITARSTRSKTRNRAGNCCGNPVLVGGTPELPKAAWASDDDVMEVSFAEHLSSVKSRSHQSGCLKSRSQSANNQPSAKDGVSSSSLKRRKGRAKETSDTATSRSAGLAATSDGVPAGGCSPRLRAEGSAAPGAARLVVEGAASDAAASCPVVSRSGSITRSLPPVTATPSAVGEGVQNKVSAPPSEPNQPRATATTSAQPPVSSGAAQEESRPVASGKHAAPGAQELPLPAQDVKRAKHEGQTEVHQSPVRSNGKAKPDMVDSDGEDDLFSYGGFRMAPPSWEESKAREASVNLVRHRNNRAIQKSPEPLDLPVGDDDDDGDEEASLVSTSGQARTVPDPAGSSLSRGDQAGSANTATGTGASGKGTRDGSVKAEAKGEAKQQGGSTSESSRLRDQLAAKDREVAAALELSRQQQSLAKVREILTADALESEEQHRPPPAPAPAPAAAPAPAPPPQVARSQEEEGSQDGQQASDSDDKLFLKAASANFEAKFRLSKRDPLLKLFQAFARKMNVPREKLKFSFDGELLSEEDTAADKDLEDEDKIDVVVLP